MFGVVNNARATNGLGWIPTGGRVLGLLPRQDIQPVNDRRQEVPLRGPPVIRRGCARAARRRVASPLAPLSRTVRRQATKQHREPSQRDPSRDNVADAEPVVMLQVGVDGLPVLIDQLGEAADSPEE